MPCSENIASKPLVSVIVLTYCQEDTIARALDSILAQQVTFPYEIVIGEDAGTDSTRSICEAYAKKHPGIVRLMPKSKNKGVVRNYFDTLLSCRGEFIADCAGDDFWCDERKLQSQVDMLMGNPEASVVHTGWYRYDELTGKRSIAIRPQMSGDIVRDIVLQTVFPVIHLCTALYRKHIIVDELGSDPQLFISDKYRCEDLQVAYVLAKRGKVLYMESPTLCYSVGHPSVSNEADELRLYEFYLSATNLACDLVRREQMTGRDVEAYFNSRIFALQMHLLRANSPQRLAELKAHASQWPVKPSIRNRILDYCIAHAPLRYALLAIRCLLVKLKRLCR